MSQDGSVFLAGMSDTFSEALNSKHCRTWAIVKLERRRQPIVALGGEAAEEPSLCCGG